MKTNDGGPAFPESNDIVMETLKKIAAYEQYSCQCGSRCCPCDFLEVRSMAQEAVENGKGMTSSKRSLDVTRMDWE